MSNRLGCVVFSLELLEYRRLLATFAVVGDTAGGDALAQVADRIKSWNPDFIATVGDNYYDADPNLDAVMGRYFHDYISPYNGSFGAGSTSGNRLWPALGNHDYTHVNGVQHYFNFFTLPNNERYYTTRQGDTELFIVNSNEQEPDGVTSTSTQGTWLKNALAASTARWKLVFMHHPAYSSGWHGDTAAAQWPYQQWGASAVFAGHDHNYERVMKSGFPYFIVGTGGAELRGFDTITGGSAVRYSADWGAMRVDTSSSAINFQFITRTGQVIDTFTLSSAPTNNLTLIPTGASWKYLDNGSNQGAAWRATSFSDSTWKTGNAELGYGDGDEATVVSFGPNSSAKYTTTYFRRSFDVSDPSAISALALNIKRDDGAVVYLNGTEVYRTNMPTGTIAYNTFASSAVEENTFYTASISPSLLTTGANVIAVEVHQSDLTSSDISFDFSLLASSSQTVSLPAAPSGLAASAASASQINLTWTDNADNEAGFKIERRTGTAGNFIEIATVAANVTTYSDSERAAGTTYQYQVRAYNSAGNSAYSNTATATTATIPVGNFVYLSDLPFAVTPINGWGPVERDTSNGSNGANDGRVITLNGVTYAKGLGVHAASDVRFNLNGQYDRFISDIGVDDEVGSNGSVGFQVWADGILLYDSGTMTGATATKTVDVSVAGRAQLRLVVTNGGNNIDYDHADWAAARLTTSTTAPIAPTAPTGLVASAAGASQINLTWADTADNESGFKIERSPSGSTAWSQIATAGTDATSYSDTNLSPATQYFYRIRATNSVGDSAYSNTASATTQSVPATLPSPWTSGDVGSVGAPGSAAFANNVFSIQASGKNVWATADSFHYVYQPWTGNGQIIVRALTPGAGPSGGFEGIMFRETIAAGSKHASLFVDNKRLGFVRRTSTGGSSSATTANGSAPVWLKLIRNGNSFTSFRSSNGTSWTQLGNAVTISMATTIHVGLVGCSSVPGTLGTFSFDGVQTGTSTSSTLAGTLNTIATTQSRTSLFSTTSVGGEDSQLLDLLA